ncbi:hypothetical protein G9464_19295 [Halostella sp. JP-L12]|uniref:hypothetical protein n=1 Tax=Halostella TaxID=1843185 RepID=UPI000EF7F3A3|nr:MULTISPECIES: hypothetical protein [Halostella]NHN49719.1 hypothetical protein [Halostella sp. JP-L12]
MTDRDSFFDDDSVASAAASTDRSPEELRDLVERHQAGMRDNPGIDGLVYEWRKTLREDPLLFADGDAYYVALPRRIWRQFATAHGLSDEEFEALLAVHDDAVRDAAAGREDADLGKLDDDVAMVLLKE